MAAVLWSVGAGYDFEQILRYLISESVPAAHDLVDKVDEAIARLTEFPRMGRAIPEYDVTDLRELIVGPYRWLYSFDMDVDQSGFWV